MVMDTERLETIPPPPGVIASLQAGFNIVSSRVALMLLPLMFDLFLWLGPRVSMGKLAGDLFKTWIDLFVRYGAPAQDIAFLTSNASGMVDGFGKINVLSRVWTFPIGIPVLMLDLPESLPVLTPLGEQAVIQLPSALALIGMLAVMTVIGWIGGGAYFRIVAGASLGEAEAGIGIFRAWVQTVFLSVLWFVGYLVIVPPLMVVIVLLSAISPLLGQTILFVLLLFAFWLVVPLFFTPHGIFARRQNALLSIINSVRMSRFTLPTSSAFVMSVFLLYVGLNYLWNVPEKNSWLMLIGLAGHAFISTMLLAASFVYYRDMNNWLQVVSERFRHPGQQVPIKKI
jgi:hypothetical protein